MSGFVNIVKLCVGAERVEDLTRWQTERAATIPGWRACHVTRMWPKRGAEVLNGGSLYWVFKGVILARQTLIGLEERRGEDGILRCALMLDAAVARTEPVPRRAFQGWRYLDPKDSPRDLTPGRMGDSILPEPMALALAEIGLR